MCIIRKVWMLGDNLFFLIQNSLLTLRQLDKCMAHFYGT